LVFARKKNIVEIANSVTMSVEGGSKVIHTEVYTVPVFAYDFDNPGIFFNSVKAWVLDKKD